MGALHPLYMKGLRDNTQFAQTHVGFPGGTSSKESTAKQETQVHSLGWEDPLEEEAATHSTILARRIPWTEEPGRLQSNVAKSQT